MSFKDRVKEYLRDDYHEDVSATWAKPHIIAGIATVVLITIFVVKAFNMPLVFQDPNKACVAVLIEDKVYDCLFVPEGDYYTAEVAYTTTFQDLEKKYEQK